MKINPYHECCIYLGSSILDTSFCRATDKKLRFFEKKNVVFSRILSEYYVLLAHQPAILFLTFKMFQPKYEVMVLIYIRNNKCIAQQFHCLPRF